MLVTSGMTSIIEALATEQKLDFRVDTAKVKPKGLTEDDMVGSFWELMHQCADRVNAVINRTSTTTHDHPWFGALNTHGWHSLLPIHTSIHRRQLEKIAGNLGK